MLEAVRTSYKTLIDVSILTLVLVVIAELVDPRALYILTYEVLYNTSQPTPVMSVCGEFYAHRFLEKFVSAQQKLNVNCPIINVKVDVKARVRLYGNKVGS